MRDKILGILVCLMLITSMLTVAKNIDKKQVNNIIDKNNILLFDEDDAPTWNVGDIWSYILHSISIDIKKGDLNFYLNGKSDKLDIEVKSVTEDSYVLKINVPIDGYFRFETVLEGLGKINCTGEFNNKLQGTSIGGTITFNKTDLKLKEANIIIYGRIVLEFTEIPNYPFNLTPPIPIPLEAKLDIQLGNPISIIDFPINTSKSWGIPSTNFTVSGSIKSIYLSILNIINRIIRIPVVMNYLVNKFGLDPVMLQQFSDLIYNLVPVFDIEYFLTNYIGGNVFDIPEVPPLIFCFGRENITVPAGTYNSYNISVLGGMGKIYYSPEVGSIVKIVGDFGGVLPSISKINAELLSYDT